jgi:hypothetical protein
MKMELQEINHNYVTRIIIFSLFLFKEHRFDKSVYEKKIRTYLTQRFHTDIIVHFDVGPDISPREQIIDKIERYKGMREESESNLNNIVYVSYKTGYKTSNLEINLFDPDKYEPYLYG